MRIVNFSEIEHLLINLQTFNGQNIYEKEYARDDFFVIYDNDIVLEELYLDNFIGDQFIEGYIFKKNLEVTKQICALDTDHSPFLVVLGNVKSSGLLLAGNQFYIGGNLECFTLWGIYNHGSLSVKGQLKTQLLYSSDFDFEFGAVSEIIFIVGDENAKYNDPNGLGLVLMTKTHSEEQVFNDLGQEVCSTGLFEYLSVNYEDLSLILRPEFDFHVDFPEKSRLSFSQIFSNPLFTKQQKIEMKGTNPDQPDLFYSFTKEEETEIVLIISAARNYSIAVLFDKLTNEIWLTLTMYTDQNMNDVQISFQMTEQDNYFQTKTAKHLFFEAEKEWLLHVKNP